MGIPDSIGRTALFVGCIAVALVAAAILSAGSGATGGGRRPDVWIPDSAHTVVLQLDDGDHSLRRLAALQRMLQAAPADADAASRYAELALQHYAVTGDARFLGYADGALDRWRNVDSPPQAIWILRGRILQTEHRFRDAAMEIDRMLRVHAGSVEAMLLAADAWRRAGAIDRAKAHCASLALTGRLDLARYCAADILLSLGNAEKALQIASMAASSSGNAATGAAQWALAVRADAAAAAGRIHVAESHYRSALALPDAAIALHVSYADLLLRDDRPRDAIDALAGLPDSDAVLLRRAMAAKRLGQADFGDYRARLLQSFSDAETLRAGALHLREKAMFELYVESDAKAALIHAKENWEIQKGPEDAAILIQAARAAGQPDVSQVVVVWRQRFNSHAG